MNKDSTDFMLQEYDRISTAYFGLQSQLTEWFKAYTTLVGLPLTILAAFFGISNAPLPNLNNIPDLVAGLLLIVGVLGFVVCLTIINMRMEMILYARTINVVRRYFVDIDQANANLQTAKKSFFDYLILPNTDALPPFYEKFRTIYWQVILMGILDGALWLISVKSIFSLSWIWSLILSFVFAFLHFYMYRSIAQTRDREWKPRFLNNLGGVNYVGK